MLAIHPFGVGRVVILPRVALRLPWALLSIPFGKGMRERNFKTHVREEQILSFLLQATLSRRSVCYVRNEGTASRSSGANCPNRQCSTAIAAMAALSVHKCWRRDEYFDASRLGHRLESAAQRSIGRYAAADC